MKNRIIFIVVFLMFSMVITSFFIQRDVNKNTIDLAEKQNMTNTILQGKNVTNVSNVAKKEKTLDESETYDLNKLKTVLCKEDYQDLEIEYYQIDGLKDKKIETEINKYLKNDLEAFVDQALKAGKVNQENFNVNAIVNSNFSNTLSISYDVFSYLPLSEEEEPEVLLDECITENFDLTTGEKIKLKDLFAEDTKAANIFNTSVYHDMISSQTDVEPISEETQDLQVVDYNDVEEIMLYLAICFNEGKDIKFVFDEQKINLSEFYVSVYYEDMMDKIVIYDKYKTEQSIFDGTYEVLENLPVLAKRFDADYEFIEQGSNYYIDVSLYDIYDSDSRNEEIFETAKKYLLNEIKQVKEKASQNSNQFFVINNAYALYTVSQYLEDKNDWKVYEDILKLEMNKYEYITTKALFNSKYYDEIQQVFKTTQRIETGEAYCYQNLFIPYLEVDYQDYENEIETIYIDKEGKVHENFES